MCHFSRSCFWCLCIQHQIIEVYSIGFPHSESSGSMLFSSSPKIVAGLRVLLRLSMPRHPSAALSNLIIKSYYYTPLFSKAGLLKTLPIFVKKFSSSAILFQCIVHLSFPNFWLDISCSRLRPLCCGCSEIALRLYLSNPRLTDADLEQFYQAKKSRNSSLYLPFYLL